MAAGVASAHDPTGGAPATALRRHLAFLAAVLALGIAAYACAFRGEFVFDDVASIVENPSIRKLGNYFASTAGYRASPHRVVAYATFALNYAFGGLDPAGYRLTNVAIHLLNALLVYALVVVAFRSPVGTRSRLASSATPIAFVTAALFVSHPLQTQAVTYVVQRMTSLTATFYLMSIVAYGAWRTHGGRTRVAAALAYSPVIVGAVLAMRTKEIAFTLPLAIALLEAVLFEGPWRRRGAYLAPALATLLVIPVSMVHLGGSASETLAQVASATVERPGLSRWDYLLTQAPVIATYLRLAVAPFGQNLDYDFPTYASPLVLPVVASSALIAALAAAALVLLRRSVPRAGEAPLDPAVRIIALGILWFFLTLSVESSFIPIQDVINEHRVYLPSVGLFAALATGGALLLERLRPTRARLLLVSAGAVLAVVLAALTFARNEVWTNNVTLWSDVVLKSPAKARPHVNLGRALMERGNAEAAIVQYELALRAEPLNQNAHNNLGVALYKTSRLDEAIAHLELAVALRPSDANAQYNLGVAYGRKGRMDLAQQHMKLGAELRTKR